MSVLLRDAACVRTGSPLPGDRCGAYCSGEYGTLAEMVREENYRPPSMRNITNGFWL